MKLKNIYDFIVYSKKNIDKYRVKINYRSYIDFFFLRD